MYPKNKKSPEKLGGNPGGRKSSGRLHLNYTKKRQNLANRDLYALLGQAFCQGRFEIVDCLYDLIQSKRGAT